ncbi:MAG: DUF6600 domain-containing protein [Verrucomicrobiota bacterium]
MKRLLLPSLLVSSLVLFTLGCGEKPVVTDAPPLPVPLKPKPKVYRGEDGKAAEAAREAEMAREIAELEAEAENLRQEIAQEQLAVDRAALEEEQQRLDQERAEWLNEQLAAAVPAQPQTPVSTPVVLPPARDYSLFYTELAVHGSWFQSVDYGYVWQPAVALQTSWRPYTVGRWAACDRGWTWLSDEPFGWATYHYGRWAKLKGCGWIWVPGEVWAPAWVAWRRSDQYVGWCPLPPETLYRDEVTYDSSIDKLCGIQPSSYIFIAVKHFCLPVHRHCEPPERSGVVCRDTANITRLSVSRHRVNGSGPKYEWIRDRHPRPPDRYILASDPLTKGDRKFRIDRDKLCVFSPVMRAPWNAALRPRDVAGPLPEGAVVPQGTVPTDKVLRRFREDKKHWMEAGTKALQGESARRLTERQERVEALTAAVQNPPAPRRTTRPQGQPTEQNQTAPRPGATPSGVLTESSLAERRAQREQVRKEVDARQAELAQLRGLPVAGETAPSRIISGGRPAIPPVVTPGARPQPGAGDQTLNRAPGRLPEVASPRTKVEPGEVPRVVESRPVTSPGTVETPVASTPGQQTAGLGPAGTIAEVPPVHSEVTAPEVPVSRETQADLEARRAEVARLKETLTVRQQQKMGPQPQGDASLNGSGQSETSGQLLRRVKETGPVPAAEPARQTPPVRVAGPQAPAGVTGPLPEESAARQETAAALAERRERAARINGELAARQQELQQQREAREQARAEREQALAQSAAEAARQRETAQAAQMALAAEQQQQEQQRQLAAETAARQLAGEAAQQQQAQLAEQAEAAREQRETEAKRQRQAAEQAQQEQAAREQAQRQAEERARQEEMARQQREAAERAQQEQAAREQAQRQAEERARQEEMVRQQREAAERAQQEQAVREQAQRQAEERARQEEMARQQREAAERAQQEQAAREQAQRQAEERARQEQAARDQAAREQAQRQAEEAARAAAEAAKNGNK